MMVPVKCGEAQVDPSVIYYAGNCLYSGDSRMTLEWKCSDTKLWPVYWVDHNVSTMNGRSNKWLC
jgi:hypothetical protein